MPVSVNSSLSKPSCLVTPRFYSNHKQQLSHKEAHTELDVDIVPHAPQRPTGGRRGNEIMQFC